MLVLIWLAVIAVALYLYFRQKGTFFSRRGVKTPPYIPFLGHMLKIMLKKQHFTDHLNECYFSFPEERFTGRFEFINPMLIIRDIELIKKIAVKDFEYFVDHRIFIDETTDPLFGRSLISLRGHEWRDMRSTLSPAFTSSKIRLMIPFMTEVGDQMIMALKNKIEATESKSLEVDVKDLIARYTNDVIASCAFGLKVNSHADTENEFYTMGKSCTSFTFKQLLLLFAFAAFPKIMKLLRLSIFSSDLKQYFKDLVMNTMHEREERHIIRPDMIHLLMEAKKGKLTHEKNTTQDADAGFATAEESDVGKKNVDRVWSDDDITAQVFLFFVGGFESVAGAASLLLHELALNPDVQDRLVEEIRATHASTGGKLDYSTIQHMVYMDMVVSETLRLWPAAAMLDRICLKDYNCGKPNSESTEDYIVRKGESVGISAWSLHRDPQYYPNPEKFDPERFSEENKRNIQPFAYIPFGLGPRSCIGSRFALCEIKVIVYQILQHFEVSPCKKTSIPAKISKESVNIQLEGGHWYTMKIRS